MKRVSEKVVTEGQHGCYDECLCPPKMHMLKVNHWSGSKAVGRDETQRGA